MLIFYLVWFLLVNFVLDLLDFIYTIFFLEILYAHLPIEEMVNICTVTWCKRVKDSTVKDNLVKDSEERRGSIKNHIAWDVKETGD